MNRAGKATLFFVCLILLLLFSAAAGEAPVDPKSIHSASVHADSPGVLALPASLRVIEDGAFEGTAATDVLLASDVRSIGARAFAAMPRLRFVNLPDSLAWVDRNAFAGSEGVTLTGQAGGLAQAYARDNNMKFQPLEEEAPLPPRERLPLRAAAGMLPYLLLSAALLLRRRMPGRAVSQGAPLRRRERRCLHPLDQCFP